MGKHLPSDLNTLKVAELKEALKERSLTVSGNKADLVARLREYISKHSQEGEHSSSSTPKKQAPSESEPQNGEGEESVKDKGAEEKEKELQGEKEKEQREKEQREKEEKEKELREKQRKENEQKEKELKAKELKEKELKEKELKEKELKAKEQKEREREKEQREKASEADKVEEPEDKENREEAKKRKNADDDSEPADSTPSRTLTKHTTPSTTPSSNNKRARTWTNAPQSINISTDILKEMLPNPSSPPTDDAEMADDAGAQHGDARSTSRPAQQVYSTPSRREKKEEEPAGPREVPAARKGPSTTLFIDRFVRPFTIPQVKQLLSQTGEVEYFWMNQVKSQAYATFKTVEQAAATREAIYDLPWPPGNGSKLRAEFSTDEEAKKVAEQHDAKRTTPTAATTPASAPVGKGAQDSRDSKDSRDSRDTRDSRDSRDLRRDSRGESRRDSREDSRRAPPPKKTLEDLFKKTKQIAAKKSTTPATDR